LGIIVLLFPALAIIVDMVLPNLGRLLSLGGGHAAGSLGWFVENGILRIGHSVTESFWMGLIAYAVLRSPHSGVGTLTGVILGYWLGAYLLLKGLSLRSFSTEAIEVLALDAEFYFAVALILSLVGSLFWLVARATRARLLAPGEINESTGLRLRDILWTITGFGVTISGVQLFFSRAAQVDDVFELRVETLLLFFLLTATAGTIALVTVFFATTYRQWIGGILIIGGLMVLDLLIPRILAMLNGDPDPSGWATDAPLPLLVFGRLTWLGGNIAGLLVLRWLWHKMGWSVSLGNSAN
jgi:hypothetical protein